MRGGVIIASNRLPVMIQDQDGRPVLTRSIGGVATALGSVLKQYDACWVGWTGMRRVLPLEDVQALELPDQLVPIQADEQLVEGYYDHIANCVFWPAMHEFALDYRATETDWNALQEIAEKFAASIKHLVRPNDVVWVHD